MRHRWHCEFTELDPCVMCASDDECLGSGPDTICCDGACRRPCPDGTLMGKGCECHATDPRILTASSFTTTQWIASGRSCRSYSSGADSPSASRLSSKSFVSASSGESDSTSSSRMAATTGLGGAKSVSCIVMCSGAAADITRCRPLVPLPVGRCSKSVRISLSPTGERAWDTRKLGNVDPVGTICPA